MLQVDDGQRVVARTAAHVGEGEAHLARVRGRVRARPTCLGLGFGLGLGLGSGCGETHLLLPPHQLGPLVTPPCGGGDLLLHTLQQRVEPLLCLHRGQGQGHA